MFDTTPQLDCAGRLLKLDRPQVMGIVNVTPDSFSDGGAHDTLEAAVAHALKLVEEGADLLDVGGESTRPGAGEVSVEEELRRVIPVIEQLSKQASLPISIKAEPSTIPELLPGVCTWLIFSTCEYLRSAVASKPICPIISKLALSLPKPSWVESPRMNSS